MSKPIICGTCNHPVVLCIYCGAPMAHIAPMVHIVDSYGKDKFHCSGCGAVASFSNNFENWEVI